MPDCKATQRQVPLTDKADQKRHPGNTQRGDRKAAHRDRHLFADTVHLTDITAVRSDNNDTGTHKERDLHDRMGHQMQIRAFDTERRQQRRA